MKLPVEIVENRKKYILFKNDDGVTVVARNGWVFEQFMFDFCRSKGNLTGATVIDIGANLGFNSLEFADIVGHEGKVYCYEPQRLIFYQLCGNILINGYNNIYASNLALGDKPETVKIENQNYFSATKINIGNSHINAYTNNGYNDVECVPLDKFNHTNVRVIKIDVQGYEPKVLDGAYHTIQRNKPIIFIEVEPGQLNIYGYTEQDVFARLDNLGYTYQKLQNYDWVAQPNWLT